ncbi:MAG TPA: condensation domain-containing protein, partial [Longimicrobiaceae bacterium]|nr:condensation domain-containing protein [Longimicrobiaceae bacterium]
MSETLDRLARLPPEKRLLLQKLLQEKAARGDGSRQGIRRREAADPSPLSFAQLRLWLTDRMQPGSPAYNLPSALRLHGALAPRVLARALGEIARRHHSLRTVFTVRDGEPVQTVVPPAANPLPAVDLGGLAPTAREGEAQRLAVESARRPFDLERGPPMRAAVLRLGPEEWVVLLVVHHIVSDGWSMGIFVAELSALYDAFSRGLPSPLPEPELQYADFAAWQREHLSGARLEEALGFWRRRLAGAPPVLDLPTDRPRPAVADPRGEHRHVSVDQWTTAALRELAHAGGATPFMALLAAWQALLGRWAGQDDVVVGSPVAGRTQVETEGLIGVFVNTLVIRTDLSGDPTFRELLARVRDTVLEAQAHQEVPFERLVEELAPERTLRHTPLFQAMFTLLAGSGADVEDGLRLGTHRARPMPSESGAARFDLELSLTDGGEEVFGRLGFRPGLFDAATADRIVSHFQALLAGVVRHPDRRLSEIGLMAEAERERVLAAWNDTARPYPPLPAHLLFARQAARTPDAVAVLAAAGPLTYAELDARADALAARLRGLGVGPEVPVGLCVERTPEMVVGVLGIWKA